MEIQVACGDKGLALPCEGPLLRAPYTEVQVPLMTQ